MTNAVSSGEDIIKFLDHTFSLWERNDGDPRAQNPPEKEAITFKGRIAGDLSLPFSIPFPSHVNLLDLSAVYLEEIKSNDVLLPPMVHQYGRITPFPYTEDPKDEVPFFTAPATTTTSSATPHISPYPLDGRGLVSQMPLRLALNSTAGATSSKTHKQSASQRPPSHTQTHSFERSASPIMQKRSVPWGETFRANSGVLPTNCPPASSNGKAERPPLSFNDPPGASPLPPSFLERDIYSNVRYELTLVVTHGRLSSTSR